MNMIKQRDNTKGYSVRQTAVVPKAGGRKSIFAPWKEDGQSGIMWSTKPVHQVVSAPRRRAEAAERRGLLH